MGTIIGRIEREFILTALIDKELPINFHGLRKDFEGKIVTSDESQMKIAILSEIPPKLMKGEPLRAFFSFYGHTMTFETRVARAGENPDFTIPKNVYKNLKRKYERVTPPVEITISFKFENTRIVLDFPKSRSYVEVDEPLPSDWFDAGDIQGLIEQFREKSAEFASDNKIIIFRGRSPNRFEEELIADTGKILFLPDTEGEFPSEDTDEEDRPIIYRELFPDPITSTDKYFGKNRQQLHFYLEEKVKNNIHGEIYCPILFQSYVIGYVWLANTGKRKEPLNWDAAEFALEFSRILAYTLLSTGYFKSEESRIEEFQPEIIDVSASGLLFTHPSEDLGAALGIYTDIDIQLQAKHRKMNIPCRVMRRYHDQGRYFFGIQFLDIAPENFRFLFDLIYGRPFTDKDEEFWEGGATPPELVL